MPVELIAIQMPDGAIEYVVPGDLLWMRKAFAGEWSGTTMLRMGSDRYFSIESLAALTAKFTNAAQKPVALTAPDGSMENIVNALRVREVEAPNGNYHPNSRATLIFAPTVKLAVRETVAEANAKLGRS